MFTAFDKPTSMSLPSLSETAETQHVNTSEGLLFERPTKHTLNVLKRVLSVSVLGDTVFDHSEIFTKKFTVMSSSHL